MKRFVNSIVVALSILAFSAAGSASAFGHAGVISTLPTQGQNLAVMPAEIVINFSENLLELGDRKVNTISLFYAGKEVVIEDALVTGSQLTANLGDGDFPAGSYEVRYRVISADGHEVSDTFTFSLGPEPASSPDQSSTPSEDSSLALPLALATTTLITALGFLIFERRRRAK